MEEFVEHQHTILLSLRREKKNVGVFPKNVGVFSKNVGENFEDVGDSKITLRLLTQKYGSKWSRYEKYSLSHAH